jgi:hypothetical protein
VGSSVQCFCDNAIHNGAGLATSQSDCRFTSFCELDFLFPRLERCLLYCSYKFHKTRSQSPKYFLLSHTDQICFRLRLLCWKPDPDLRRRQQVIYLLPVRLSENISHFHGLFLFPLYRKNAKLCQLVECLKSSNRLPNRKLAFL